MSQDELINKYRPAQWDELLGHGETVAALRRAMDTPSRPHALRFTGPSGVGKTTTARIIAKHVGAEVVEIDAASNSGVDAMRALVELADFVPLSESQLRMVIIDECHTLSKNAWQVLLKILEEPPPYLFIALCTTEAEKIPDTVNTRSYPVQLRKLSVNDIRDLIEMISALEEMNTPEDVLTLIVQEADGSARQAINLLQVLNGAKDADEARRIVTLVNGDDEAPKRLCRELLGEKPWVTIAKTLTELEDQGVNYEQLFVGTCRYMTKVMQNGTKDGSAHRAYIVLNALTFPANTFDPKAAFYAAVGRVVFKE